jgi:hypothetical protein
MAPKEGDAHTFGGKTFHLTYLSVDGQQALDRLLSPWMGGAHSLPHAQLFEAIKDSIPKAAALILSEQDPDATEEWVGKLKGKAIRQQLFTLVMAQVELDDLGKFYAALSYAAAKLRQAASAP